MSICPIEWRDVAAMRAPSPSHLTDWIDGTQAPVRVGWYERYFTDSLIMRNSVQYWDGEYWLTLGTDARHWRQLGAYPAWRGLTESHPSATARNEKD